MIVMKFGGASVCSAEAIKNISSIVKNIDDGLVIVASAMGKTTQSLEKLTRLYFQKNEERFHVFARIRQFHLSTVKQTITCNSSDTYDKVESVFDGLLNTLNKEPSLNYDFEYDQIVSLGEIMSTLIISGYLNSIGIRNHWIDARKYIKTDNTYREAKIDWTLSTQLLNQKITFLSDEIYLTQGFIGATTSNLSTTLGKEGSDFTAAALAYMLDAEKVIVWKDVSGIYNADPKIIPDAIPIPKISYRTAVELAFYGAKIIHPKTIKPIENKEIPLFVKSFVAPTDAGTIITGNVSLELQIPVYIFKDKQILISILPTDFSFIAEDNLSKIFGIFAQHRIKINVMQNSAVSFSACVDNQYSKITALLDDLKAEFKTLYNANVELITIRNYTEKAIEKNLENKKVLLEQRSRNMAHFVVLQDFN